ncbi:LytR/AlgR family response regulator transcription factor [Vagococcus carniphilus]|uniref:LytR/AlgR family response regulator transcription factor n=1 Tax=Vagococcus carniphilus TaxID=218144 RepID=UPI003BAC7C99
MKVLSNLINHHEEEQVIFDIHERSGFLDDMVSRLEMYEAKTILVKDYQKNIMIPLNVASILYIEYLERKCFFYTSEKTYEKRMTLNVLRQELPEEFIQISKTTILNTQSVKEIKSSLLNGNLYCLLSNQEEILVSRHFVRAFREKISQRNRQK